MVNLSYNISPEISSILNNSDKVKDQILTTPLSPRDEVRLRWENTLDKIYWGLSLAESPLSRNEMSKLLSNPQLKKMTDNQKEVVGYANTINYIRNNWSASKVAITTKDVLDIYNLSCLNVFGSTTAYFKYKEKETAEILNFIESGKDHPIIKAGLLQIEIIKLSPFENGTGRVARLLSQLILSKYNFDVRGLLCIEDYYRNDLISLKEASYSIEKYKSATIWLKYFSQGVFESLQKTLSKIDKLKSINNSSDNLWKLNARLQKIIDNMENPNTKMTNREIQKRFGVSQITASRDLSKLTALGIIITHGKGRSVFYTK